MSQLPLLERIADLLDREHDAIAAFDIDALSGIQLERQEQLAELVRIAPSEQAAFTSVETRRARNERAAEAALSRLGRGRAALAGYRPNAGDSMLSRALDQEV
jgi:hypothetical protein